MKLAIKQFAGFVAGGAIGVGTLLALGADGPARPFPHYSVEVGPGALSITDHDSNLLHLYEHAGLPDDPRVVSRYRLLATFDLSEAGQPEMKAKGAAK